MSAYWLSWYHSVDLGSFELRSPWWVSGYRCADDAATICAAVRAENEQSAKEAVKGAYDKRPALLEWRFVEPFEGSPFDDRFPRAEWMVWDAPGEAGEA